MQSNDKHQDVYEVLSSLRPNGVGTDAISATLDNGSGKAGREQISHASLKMTLSPREQSTIEITKPRKVRNSMYAI
jgi:hypothetical protein